MCYKKNDSFCCCITSLIISMLVGVTIGGLFYIGAFTILPIINIITLVLGVIGLIRILFSIFCRSQKTKLNMCYIANIVGSILIPIFILISNPLAIASEASGLVVIALGFMFAYSLMHLLDGIFRTDDNFSCND